MASATDELMVRATTRSFILLSIEWFDILPPDQLFVMLDSCVISKEVNLVIWHTSNIIYIFCHRDGHGGRTTVSHHNRSTYSQV